MNGPISAYCQADIIDHHTQEITGGKTYAELDQEDPNRAVAMDSAFLQASLFTSVVAFGVAAMAFVLGIVLTLIGFAIRAPAPPRTGHASDRRLTAVTGTRPAVIAPAARTERGGCMTVADHGSCSTPRPALMTSSPAPLVERIRR